MLLKRMKNPKFHGCLAQLGERRPYKAKVAGSIPSAPISENGVVVQLVRIPACHVGGRGVESRPLRFILIFVRELKKMLQTIREYTQGWIAGLIISVVILSFALWGIHSYFIGGGNNNVVAEVNGVDITREQLTVAYERLRRQIQAQYGSNHTMTAKDDAFLKDRALRALIDQPKLGVLFTSFALPYEVAYTISLVNEERNIQYLNIPLQYFLLQPIKISSEKIKAYYDKNQNDFMTPEQVNVEYVELSMKDVATNIDPTDVILKNFYNENINSYTQATAWKLADIEIPVTPDASSEQMTDAEKKANSIVQALEKGQAFSEVARGYHSTLSTEWMTLNQVPTELQKEVASLTKTGQFTQPIKTSKGYAIVSIIDFKEPKIQPFEEIKNKVRETYIRQHADEKFAELREQLANMTYEHPDSLTFAAKELGLTIKTSELFSQDKPGKDISQYKKVRDTAFSRDVLEVQNNSDVIQINPETIIVLRVKSHLASALLPLEGISKQIEDKLRTQEAEVQAETFAKNFQSKLFAGANPEKLASQYGFTWVETGYIGRSSNKVDRKSV